MRLIIAVFACLATAGAQYLSLPNASSSRFTVTDRVWPASHGEGDVCLWEDDKMIAVTKGIDDNICGEHDWWMSMGEKYGFKFTWFVIVYPYMYDYDGSTGTNTAFGNAATFQRLFDAGHDVQAHGTGSINDLSDSLYDQDVRLTQKLLTDSIPGNRVRVYAYPGGDATGNKQSIVGRYYIGGRGTTGAPNIAARTTYLHTNDGSLSDYTIDDMIDNPSSIYYRGWLSSLSHMVALTGQDSATRQASYDAMERQLAYIKQREDDIWMTVYRKASLYGQERDSHTLTVSSVTADEIQFTVSDSMLDSVFTYPLSVKFRLNDDWDDMTALQDGSPVDYRIYWHEGNKYAIVKPVPDQGTVVLTKVAPTVVADPVFAPGAGTYNDSVEIELTCITTGAEIHYTTDGSDPDDGDRLYSAPFRIYGSGTVKAVAYKSGLTASGIASADYTVEIDSIAPVIAAAAAGGLATQLIVSFDGVMDVASAGTALNYAVDNGIGVSAASVQSDSITVILTVDALTAGTGYTLTVDNVKDRSQNAIASGSMKAFTFTVATGDDGLTGHWNFDEDTDAAFAVDLSGNGNTALFVDNALREDDRKGGAARFDGADAHLVLGTSQWGITSTNEFSIALWFKYTGGWGGNLLSRGSVAPFSLPAHYSTPTIRSVVRLDGGTNYVSGNAEYDADQWYHMAITYTSGSYKIYINGVLDVDQALTGSPSVTSGSSTASGTGLNGWIDDLRIYNKELSVTEVAALFADSTSQTDTTIVATPIIMPGTGSYDDRVQVTVSCITAGAELHYTTDGSDPLTDDDLYTDTLTFTATTTLKVRGFLAGRDSSDMAEAVFTVNADNTAPSLLSVTAADNPAQVLVTFSEPVAAVDAETPGNYSIPGLAVSGASLDADNTTVTLTVDSMEVDSSYTLTVGTVTDRAVSPNTATNLQRAFTYTENSGTVLGGLTAYWSMNTVVDGTVEDEAGDYDGTVTGAVWNSDGRSGGGLEFDGDDNLDVGTGDFGIDSTKAFTACAWFKADALSGYIFNKGAYVFPFVLQIYSGRIRTVVRFSGTNYISGTTSLATGTWYHAAVTVEDTTVTLYLNGQEEASRTVTGTLVNGAGQYTYLGTGFDGIIDEAQIYNRALSAAEVTALYEGVSLPSVAAPVMGTAAGTYGDSVEVSVICADAGASLYYTVDGSDPDSNATAYAGPFMLYASATVKAIGYLDGYLPSAVVAAAYTVTRDTSGVYDIVLDGAPSRLTIANPVHGGMRFMVPADGFTGAAMYTPAGARVALRADACGNGVMVSTDRAPAPGAYVIEVDMSSRKLYTVITVVE